MAPQSRGNQRPYQGPHTKGDSDDVLPAEVDGNGNKNGETVGRRDKDATGGPNEKMPTRWNEETTGTSPYTEANI